MKKLSVVNATKSESGVKVTDEGTTNLQRSEFPE
jgi:hypothetical protein